MDIFEEHFNMLKKMRKFLINLVHKYIKELKFPINYKMIF